MTTRRKAPVVAIDGPAGAGKSTVSSRVAEALGYTLLNTGALYRCVGLVAMERGVLDAPEAVAAIARELGEAGRIRFVDSSTQNKRVFLDGRDVSETIRSEEVGLAASRVSAIEEVRRALLGLQQRFGREGHVVVEGRDIATVVFPDAEVKIFLTASAAARAQRRFEELKRSGEPVTFETIEREVQERDRRDSQRPVAPLQRAPDAIHVDSTGQSVDQIVDQIVEAVRRVEARMNQ